METFDIDIITPIILVSICYLSNKLEVWKFNRYLAKNRIIMP